MKKAMWILWPSFVVAGMAEVVFFTVIDPQELYLLGEPVSMGRMATYSVGFLLFWSLAAASSAFTCFLQRTAAEVNACPLEAPDRPLGCPKRSP
jgi:hypothetical protein